MRTTDKGTALAAALLAALVGHGCRCGLPDPSCSVRDELCDEHPLREALYCPSISSAGIQETDWYPAPLVWQPQCDSATAGQIAQPGQRPTAERVFAVPTPKPVESTAP